MIPAVHAPSRRASLGRKEGWRAHLSPVVDSCLRAAGIGSEPAAPVGRLLAASSQICEAGTGEERHLTGFWFDGPAASEGAAAPPRALAFFQKYPRPLVLSYSSQPLRDAPAELAVIVEAARHLGRGLVVQEGWAGFAAALLPERLRGDDLLFVGSIPHDLLFAGAGAVIHHGGIGTLARAIRCSCPMLVAPHGNDQFYNAQRVVALGVGAAFHPLRTSSAEVARLLAERVLSAATGGRVEALAAVLRAEDGPRAAAELIESWLPRRVVPHKGEVARDG